MSIPQVDPSIDDAAQSFDNLPPAKRRELVAQFRDELLAGVPEELRAVYVQSPEVSGEGSRYGARALNGTGVDRLDPDQNLYFCIGAVSPFIYEDTGNKAWRRVKENVGAGMVIGFDDIGTKSRVGLDFFTSTLPPTVVTETSPGNFQILYFFDTPILDSHEFEDVLASIIKPLHEQYGIDQLADINHVFRIPWGINSKRYDKDHQKAGQLKYADENGKPWRVRLKAANYGLRYPPQQIAEAYGLKIVRTPKPIERPKREFKTTAANDYKAFGFRMLVDAAIQAKAAKRVSTSGGGEKWRITCPWADEHASGRAGDSAFVADPLESKHGHYTFFCASSTCSAARDQGDRTFDRATDKAGVWDEDVQDEPNQLGTDDPAMCVEAWATQKDTADDAAADDSKTADFDPPPADDDAAANDDAAPDGAQKAFASIEELEKTIDFLIGLDGPFNLAREAAELGIPPAVLEKLIRDRRAYNSDEERRAREARERDADALRERMKTLTVDMEHLGDMIHEPPAFVIKDWLPEGYVTLLSAHGAGGKSSISLYIAICTAAGLPVLGQPAQKRRKVLFYSCEDHMPVLNWRVQQYCEALNLDSAALEGLLYVMDAGALERPELFAIPASGPRTIGTTTPAFAALKQLMADESIDIVVIDNASDVNAASEIDRAAVSAFIRSLEHLLQNNRGAVLLLGHVNRAATQQVGNAVGQQYSGSTGWHNKVRSRWELTRGGKEESEDEWGSSSLPYILKRAKGNYASSDTNEGLKFHWDSKHSVILPDDQPTITPAERMANMEAKWRSYERIVLAALAKARELRQDVATSATANNNAAKVFEAMGIVLPEKIREMKGLSPVLAALQSNGLIETEEYKNDQYKIKARWKITEKGLAESDRKGE